jgi:phosphoglycolate phosphatase-like HAD superfamily hydrolase
MKFFFTAVGFPEQIADKANIQYQEVFMKKYAPAPFPDTYAAIRSLHKKLRLGIVTSNVRQNIESALGACLHFFDPQFIFTKDDNGFSKTGAIASALKGLRLNAREAIYVGDQPADWEAAKEMGVNFLGVAYGWGISEEDTEFPVAKRPSDVPEHILSWNCHPNSIGPRTAGGPFKPTFV